MQRNKEVISVSTDIGGVFGRPGDVAEVYSDCRKIVDFGLEVICWKGISKSYFEGAEMLGMRVNGLHGPVNASDEISSGSLFNRLRGKAIDGLMIGSDRIQELSSFCPTAYVLIHQRLVDSPKNLERVAEIARGFNGDTVLLVENLNNHGSIVKTVEAVEKLSGKGIRCGILIDLVHLVKDIANSYRDISVETVNKYWAEALAAISTIAAKIDTVGFHIPIGLNPSDSLPVDEMETQQWVDFAKLTAECPSVRFKTIENQRRNSRMPFLISRQEMKFLRERNLRIISGLHQTGVI